MNGKNKNRNIIPNLCAKYKQIESKNNNKILDLLYWFLIISFKIHADKIATIGSAQIETKPKLRLFMSKQYKKKYNNNNL